MYNNSLTLARAKGFALATRNPVDRGTGLTCCASCACRSRRTDSDRTLHYMVPAPRVLRYLSKVRAGCADGRVGSCGPLTPVSGEIALADRTHTGRQVAGSDTSSRPSGMLASPRGNHPRLPPQAPANRSPSPAARDTRDFRSRAAGAAGRRVRRPPFDPPRAAIDNAFLPPGRTETRQFSRDP